MSKVRASVALRTDRSDSVNEDDLERSFMKLGTSLCIHDLLGFRDMADFASAAVSIDISTHLRPPEPGCNLFVGVNRI